MNIDRELLRLQERVNRLVIQKSPPALRMVYLKHDAPIPAGLDEWTLGIQIEEKNPTTIK